MPQNLDGLCLLLRLLAEYVAFHYLEVERENRRCQRFQLVVACARCFDN